MDGVMRLTPAQRRAMTLLATPGAEAFTVRSVDRWSVTANQDGIVLGTVASRTLLLLRAAGLVEMFRGGDGAMDFRQRLTPKGREWSAAPSAGAAEAGGGG